MRNAESSVRIFTSADLPGCILHVDLCILQSSPQVRLTS
jgi:hypothetical protein